MVIACGSAWRVAPRLTHGWSGANLSQDVPPLRWDVPPDIEKVGRPSHPPLKVWDRRLRTSRFKFTVTVAPACPLRLTLLLLRYRVTSPLPLR
jgi:hypothetical protein